MAEPALYIDPERFAAFFDGAVTLSLSEKLRENRRLQSRLSWLLRAHYQLDSGIGLETLDEADMTIGSRFLPPFLGYRSSFVRRIGIHFFASLISFLTGYQVTDPTSGFRAFNRKMIKIFAEDYSYDYPEPEAIMVARRYQARVKEVPVVMRKRSKGHSSIRYFYTLYYMIKVTFAIILTGFKKKKSAV